MTYEHLDLFSGLGGFAIAARCAGFNTVAFCESDHRCRTFLKNRYGLPVEPDIRALDGTRYAGIALLTGGPPCQPASRAGKQGGAKDDRWLWSEALRVLGEAKPDSVLFENPPGILDVGIDGILSQMGRFGYETQCFDIPACAVDSPQLRHRIWIVGFLDDASRRRSKLSQREGGCATGTDETNLANASRDGERGIREEAGTDRERVRQSHQPDVGDMADTERQRHQRAESERQGITELCRTGDDTSPWQNSLWVPCADNKLRRAPDDSFHLVNGLHRSILGALGNSIVPQVAAVILKAVKANLLRYSSCQIFSDNSNLEFGRKIFRIAVPIH